MRRSVLFALLLAACSEPGFAPSTPGDGGVTLVPTTGYVFDSLTGSPLVGVTVSIGGQFLPTDGQGRFAAEVAAGANTISITTAGYESFSRVVTAIRGSEFDLPLRRLAPYPTSCQMTAQGFSAIIIDLQGRKSLERWSQSSLTLVTPSSTRPIGALQWGYTPLDTYRWKVSVDDADPATTRADWALYDSQGDIYRGSCEPIVIPSDTTTF